MSFANPGAKGAWAEALVIADLLGRGYEVFDAVNPSATCDLIAMLDGELLRVEVRKAHLNISGVFQVGVPERDRFDILAIVLPDSTVHYQPCIGSIETVEFTGVSCFRILPSSS